MTKALIDIHGLGKMYRVKSSQKNDRQGLVKNMFRKLMPKYTSIWPLRNINLSIYEGEKIALIGRNGSGKSTLLKVINEITDPTEGKVILRGKVSGVLGAIVGFHPELTGKENIYLYGALMGMTTTEIDSYFNDIVSFGELGDFLLTPIKRYSSGMKARLAFSIVVQLPSKVLLLDEVLAVCDDYFRRKALEKVNQLSLAGCAIIIVSHDIDLLLNICDKAIHIDQGDLVKYGSIESVMSSFIEASK